MLAVATAITPACAPAPAPGLELDENGMWLPPGFRSRVIARSGQRIEPSGLEYRIFPDGAATFGDAAVPGGWYLTVNHEIPGAGGVTSIRFAPDGTVTGAESICSGTGMNCAGGATPWGTWLTCEEFDWGHVWECDPSGERPAVRRRAMGAFAHEAAAVADDGRIYLTEDRRDGGFYRFTPVGPEDLSDGLLEVATGAAVEGPVSWVEVPNPDPQVLERACRHQVRDSLRFDGGEGIATSGELVWFTTKGDERVWEYSVANATMRLRLQAGRGTILSGVDNLWFDDPSRTLLVAEDGGDMEVVVLRPDDTLDPLARLPEQPWSEIAGPCFSPDGARLYFSSQRGPVGDGPLSLPLGVTYEVTGPFDEFLGRTPLSVVGAG